MEGDEQKMGTCRFLYIYLDGHGNSVGKRGLLQLLSLSHFRPLLQLVMVDDILISGTRLGEGVQIVHLPQEPPKSFEFT